MSKRIPIVLVTGAGGALGGHLVRKLMDAGYKVRAVDRKGPNRWWQRHRDAENIQMDLSNLMACRSATRGVDWVFNLAADMGGIGFIESHRADCMMSVLINTHMIQAAREAGVLRYWYASSACVYAAQHQDNPSKGYTLLKESDAYPAMPEAGYGEEKLFSERMCQYAAEDYGLTTRIARMHNVYAPFSAWNDGREKAPAALCRKVAQAEITGSGRLEIWGDGTRTRSFLYVDDFTEGALQIMCSDYPDPVNLGSDEVVTINQLADIVEEVAGTSLTRVYDTSAPQGVYGRGSDNDLIRRITGWAPSITLRQGIEKLYPWVYDQVRRASR